MKKKMLTYLILVLTLALVLSGCSKPAEAPKADAPKAEAPKTEAPKAEAPKADAKGADEIHFALLAPLTGQNAEYGKGFKVATEMAAEEINAAGGIKGKKIVIEVADSKAEPKESSDLARQFADKKEIMAIIGDFSSGASMANAPIVDAAGLVQISPTASNPKYAEMSKYTFSIMGRQDAEGPYVVNYVLGKKMGAKKVGVIYINSDWGVAVHKATVDEMKKIGIEVVAEANYVSGETDFSSVVSKVKAANPDTVLLLDQGAVPAILLQMQKVGWRDKVQVATLGPGASEQLVNLAGKSAEGLYTSTPFFFDPANAKDMAWAAKFKEKAGFAPTVHPVCAYDVVYILKNAIEKIDGEITREKIREQVQATDIVGMTGPIKFNPAGDVTRKYLMAQVKDGKWIQAEGYDYVK